MPPFALHLGKTAMAARALAPAAARALPCGPKRQERLLCRASSTAGSGQPQEEPSSSGSQQEPRMSMADALAKSLGDVSSTEGRVSQSKNIVLGADNSEAKWRELDEQVNEYPGQRTFKAIGSGGDDFVAAMRQCVESVVGTVHEECVSCRASSNGNWISATIGPVWVQNPDQVLEIYNKMKADGRLKFYI